MFFRPVDLVGHFLILAPFIPLYLLAFRKRFGLRLHHSSFEAEPLGSRALPTRPRPLHIQATCPRPPAPAAVAKKGTQAGHAHNNYCSRARSYAHHTHKHAHARTHDHSPWLRLGPDNCVQPYFKRPHLFHIFLVVLLHPTKLHEMLLFAATAVFARTASPFPRGWNGEATSPPMAWRSWNAFYVRFKF